MSYRKQQENTKTRKRSGKGRRRRLPFRLSAFMTGIVLILILCVKGIISGGSGGITGEAAGSQTVAASAATDATPGEKASQTHQVKNAQNQEWNLFLVNPWNPIPDNYEPELTYLKNGQAVDSRCYPELQQMMDDCRAAGCEPLICSSYRTQEKQESLFEQKVDSLLAEGYSQTQAEEIAGENVAVPGTSEHQLGLAVDIVDVNQQVLEEEQEDTPTQQWLLANSWKYGFILRYPENKSSITGITYEPWHYRYVGRQAAQEIYSQGICLEEYLESIK